MDMLSVLTYVARYSAFNPIEQLCPHSVMPLLELFYHHAFQVSHYHQQNNQQKHRPLINVEVKRKSFLIMQCLLVLPIGKIQLLTTFQQMFISLNVIKTNFFSATKKRLKSSSAVHFKICISIAS